MVRLSLFCIFIALFFSAPVLAQQDTVGSAKIPYINSGDFLTRGRALHDSGYYKQALALYTQIPDGDTNYSKALYEAAMSSAADSQYAKAKDYALRGQKAPYANRRDFMLLLADINDYLGYQDSACIIYDSLMKLDPNDNQPYFEKGVVLFRKEQYDSAMHLFQHSLMLNPYHFRSHYLLGNAYLIKGRLSEALMAYECATVAAANIDQARSPMQMITMITNETDEANDYYNKRSSKGLDPAFDEIDQIINAKLAMSTDYKLQTSVKENDFRQMQVLMEKLTYDPADKNFAMQYYVPLLTKLYKEDRFEPYMLFLFSGYNIEVIDKAAKSKKKEVEETKNIVYDYLNKIRNTRVLDYEKRKTAPAKYMTYDDGLEIAAVLKDKEKGIYAAGPMQAYENGSLLATGAYDASGKKTGIWHTYYASGALKGIKQYKDDSLVGDEIVYYRNGNISAVYKHDNAGKEIEEDDYNYKGILETVTKLISENETEVTDYYENGTKEGSYRLLDKKVKDGKYTTRYDNGALKKEMEFKDAKLTGNYKLYYENGKLESEFNYEDGKKEGPCADYYENGQLKDKYICHNDNTEGEYLEYWENGNLSRKAMLHGGDLDGADSNYDKNGRAFTTILYRKDVPYYERVADKDGNVLIEKKDENGLDKLVYYFPNGNKRTVLHLNEKGDREGKCSFYNSTGSKNEETYYKDGKAEGLSTEYYKDGQISLVENYKNGTRDGYYHSFYLTGGTKAEGWYKDGEMQGVWKFYYSNGKLSEEAFYINGLRNGHLTSYNIAGKIEYKEVYDKDMLCGLEQYDSSGHIVFIEEYAKGNGHYHQKVAKTDIFESNMKNGLLAGPYMRRSATGKTIEKGYNLLGKRDSAYISYYDNGKEHIIGQYKNGRKQGLWKSYNLLGEPETEENYKDDNDEGKYFYYLAGMPRYEYNYHNDKREGQQIIYGEDKKIACILMYSNGELEGYTYEDKDGKLLPVIPVKNGTAKIVSYYPNGNKSAELNYVESIRTGDQLIYFSNGQPANKAHYEKQMLQGPTEMYFPNGKLFTRVTYKDDQENGPEQVYDMNGKLVWDANFWSGSLHGLCHHIDPVTKKTNEYNYRYGTLVSVK